MAWLEIRLLADSDVAEALSDALLEAGALSVHCEDADAGTADESAQFAEPGVAAPGVWPRNVITALLSENDDPGDLLKEAATACGIEAPGYRTTRIGEQDWVRETQAQFEPIPIGDRLWIVPSWCEPPDPRAINIRIDPGLAFGTGSHATTRLMLRWLVSTLEPGETLLDYGCGSGVLAIAAARLGARDVAGVDIDPQALLAAEDNAARNAVPARFCLPDALPPQPAEVVVANILANPLVVLAPLIAAHCAGRVALSGILETQTDQVAMAYDPYFDIAVGEREDGWVLMTGARR